MGKSSWPFAHVLAMQPLSIIALSLCSAVTTGVHTGSDSANGKAFANVTERMKSKHGAHHGKSAHVRVDPMMGTPLMATHSFGWEASFQNASKEHHEPAAAAAREPMMASPLKIAAADLGWEASFANASGQQQGSVTLPEAPVQQTAAETAESVGPLGTLEEQIQLGPLLQPAETAGSASSGSSAEAGTAAHGLQSWSNSTLHHHVDGLRGATLRTEALVTRGQTPSDR
eukprot:TRINITY_DN47790_c0_g1_i2.p1 TRINITY_DN47790_c0_g1~~TRINITY_DN47790_c0_g1_i2.p1  ORF type:complete len:241 (-),score=55.30 TRINITY_DN47790_c0_g1_i2:22-708(-)